VAYFSLSEIFVNDRDHRLEGSPYPLEKENVGCGTTAGRRYSEGVVVLGIVEKLRIEVDIVAFMRLAGTRFQ
jgi:hypothetical protein